MNKCSVVFIVGIATATVTFAFFDMPNKMFQFGQQMMMPQQEQSQPNACTCVCK